MIATFADIQEQFHIRAQDLTRFLEKRNIKPRYAKSRGRDLYEPVYFLTERDEAYLQNMKPWNQLFEDIENLGKEDRETN